jgi:hypothetical protein
MSSLAWSETSSRARLGQSIAIDNRAGGNTIIGTQATAQSAPDGYTLLLTNGALSINQSLVANLPYDLDKDLAPVIWLGESYGLLVVNDKAPAKTLPELIKLAKEIMDKVTEIYAKVVKSANIKAEWRCGLSPLRPRPAHAQDRRGNRTPLISLRIPKLVRFDKIPIAKSKILHCTTLGLLQLSR